MPIERQAEEVDKVKRSESGMIRNPITLKPDRTVREALEVMRKYSISGIPIVSEEHLVAFSRTGTSGSSRTSTSR